MSDGILVKGRRKFTGASLAAPKEPKEIFVVKGATHIDMYDKPQFVTLAVAKLKEFFEKALR